MNRIILIGNGFDLAHGLKTSYLDFIDYYWEKKKDLYDKHIFYYTHLFNSGKGIPKYQDEEIVIDEISNDQTSENLHFQNLFLKQIDEKKHLHNWVDIEEEYYLSLKECVDDKMDIEKLNSDFSVIKKALEEYLSEIQGTAPLKNYNVFLPIDTKIYSVAKQEDFQRKLEVFEENVESILFLSFNYTTTEKRYPIERNYLEKIFHIHIHIHGELNNPDNPIIFGYGDEIDDSYRIIEKKNDNRFLDNIKSIKYLETDNYRKLMNFINTNAYQIFIMGHSCGISDRTLLNTLFEHENCLSIKVFFHKKEDGTDNYSDIVRNISRNFNDKKIFREKVVNKKYSEPLLLL